MRIAALIEILPTADGQLPVELLGYVYETSVTAPVVLVMADSLRDQVDRALDLLVPRLPMYIPGVRFVSDEDVQAVAHYARIADRVVLGSTLLALVARIVSPAALPVVADMPSDWRVGAPLPASRAAVAARAAVA